MSLALSLLPDVDGLDGLIEASMPLFVLWLIALGTAVVVVILHDCIDRMRHRSPVEKLLRRRFG